MKAKKAQVSRTSQSSRRNQRGPIRPAASMPVVNPHAAGIDVGSVEHYVCVPQDTVAEGESNVRSFGAFTAIPLAQKLEAAKIEVVLVNARHLKYVPGRKSDVKDCQWLQQLHAYGLLNGSFRPAQDICCLRSLMRHRENLIGSCGREVQHMQKALQEMNVHLHHAVSELTGATGLRILDAILAGERDPRKLAELRDSQCSKTTVEELEQALRGDWRPEHLFVLKQALETYRHLVGQVAQCDAQVEQALAAVVIPERIEPEEPAPKNPASKPAPRKPKRFHHRKTGTCLKQDLTEELKRVCGVDLTQVIGLNVLSVLIILSEIGLDMSRWRNARAFCSWLGLCPGNKISGGRVLNSQTAHVVNRMAILLRTLAPSIGKTDTWLGIFHRRMKSRLGAAGANTATARKLACLIYHLLKYKEDYIDVDHLVLLEKIRKQRVKRLHKLAEELGMEVVEKQMVA